MNEIVLDNHRIHTREIRKALTILSSQIISVAVVDMNRVAVYDVETTSQSKKWRTKN